MIEQPGAQPYTYWTYEQGQIVPTDGGIAAESRLTIFINMQEIATTPGAADGVMYYSSGTFVVYITPLDPYGRDYAYRLCRF